MARSRTIPIAAPAPAWKGNADCRHCGVRDIVLFADLTDADLVRELRALVIDAAVELTRLDPAAAERFSAAARPVLGEEALRG